MRAHWRTLIVIPAVAFVLVLAVTFLVRKNHGGQLSIDSDFRGALFDIPNGVVRAISASGKFLDFNPDGEHCIILVSIPHPKLPIQIGQLQVCGLDRTRDEGLLPAAPARLIWCDLAPQELEHVRAHGLPHALRVQMYKAISENSEGSTSTEPIVVSTSGFFPPVTTAPSRGLSIH